MEGEEGEGMTWGANGRGEPIHIVRYILYIE